MAHRILLVEDEPGLSMSLSDLLRSKGFDVETSADGIDGLQRASGGAFDLLVLDVMLPGKSGFEVCRELREKGIDVLILMLTARGQVMDKVTGLQLGADDYVTKPFDSLELLARIEALIRRAPRKAVKAGTYQFGDVTIDFHRAEVQRAGTPVTLSAREYQLLCYLVEHKGKTVTREELLNEVWGYNALPASMRTVDVHVAWLRQKLEPSSRFPQAIQTVRGAGYRFEEPRE